MRLYNVSVSELDAKPFQILDHISQQAPAVYKFGHTGKILAWQSLSNLNDWISVELGEANVQLFLSPFGTPHSSIFKGSLLEYLNKLVLLEITKFDYMFIQAYHSNRALEQILHVSLTFPTLCSISAAVVFVISSLSTSWVSSRKLPSAAERRRRRSSSRYFSSILKSF